MDNDHKLLDFCIFLVFVILSIMVPLLVIIATTF